MRHELEFLYRQHRQGLFSLALSITGCRARAEDAVHDAFVRLCAADTWGQGDQVSYVFAAVRNAAIDHRRRLKGQQRVVESIFNGYLPPSTTHRPDAEVLTAERDRCLRQAIQDLEEADRVVVTLRAFAGLTFDQISVVVDLPMKTVATRYRRALLKLKQNLCEGS